MHSFCRKNHVHKIPRFRGGGGILGFGGGGGADFIFMGARIFLTNGRGGFGSQTAADPPVNPRRTLKSRLQALWQHLTKY